MFSSPAANRVPVRATVPDIKIPGVLSWDERLVHVKHAVSLGLPRLMVRPKREGFVSIACYGPSLADTYRDMAKPIISVSGAHDYLLGKGIVPTWHIECDPRPHKAQMLAKANDETEYLIASCCHPDVFDALRGRNVYLWHVDNCFESRQWAFSNDPDGLCIGGGSNVGLRAFEIAHVLGFRELDVHGMDCSFRDSQWAGDHSGKPKDVIYVRADGSSRMFATHPVMVQAAREAVEFWRTHDVKMKVRGSGLMQHMMRQSMASMKTQWQSRPKEKRAPRMTFSWRPS